MTMYRSNPFCTSGMPWTRRGPGPGADPIQVAALAGRLSAETVKALGDEASGPTGRLLGIPVDGQDDTVNGLQADILNAKGKVALLETGDWGNSGESKVDLKTERFGARAAGLIGATGNDSLPGDLQRRGPQCGLVDGRPGGGGKGSMASVPLWCSLTPGAAGGSGNEDEVG